MHATFAALVLLLFSPGSRADDGCTYDLSGGDDVCAACSVNPTSVECGTAFFNYCCANVNDSTDPSAFLDSANCQVGDFSPADCCPFTLSGGDEVCTACAADQNSQECETAFFNYCCANVDDPTDPTDTSTFLDSTCQSDDFSPANCGVSCPFTLSGGDEACAACSDPNSVECSNAVRTHCCAYVDDTTFLDPGCQANVPYSATECGQSCPFESSDGQAVCATCAASPDGFNGEECSAAAQRFCASGQLSQTDSDVCSQIDFDGQACPFEPTAPLCQPESPCADDNINSQECLDEAIAYCKANGCADSGCSQILTHPLFKRGTYPCVSGRARRDPHLWFAHGGRADVRGVDGAVYNLLTGRNVSLNVAITYADFVTRHHLVHGSHISGAFATLRSNATGSIVLVEYNASHSAKAYVRVIHAASGKVAGKSATNGRASRVVVPPPSARGDGSMTVLLPGKAPLLFENINVSLSSSRDLRVSTGSWLLTAQISPFPFAEKNLRKLLLDVAIAPERGYDPDSDPVGPHGIIGQSYDGDGIGVSGAVDEEVKDVNTDSQTLVEVTTHAQAEGAIEGTLSDYRIDAAHGRFDVRFGTGYKYSRFDSAKAGHRDASKLSGFKSSVKPPASAAAFLFKKSGLGAPPSKLAGAGGAGYQQLSSA